MTKTYVAVGDTFNVTLPYSEVCMFMRIAGKRMTVTLVGNHAVQLLNDNGSDFSFPITSGEAGVFTEYEYNDDGDIVNSLHYVTGNTPVVNGDGELVVLDG